jgi:tRNA-uridine 2-sulfurtransferase
MTDKIKALGLLSGGLDSTLAVRIMAELGIKVKAINFSTGFCLTDHHRLLNRPTDRTFYNESLRAAQDLDVEIDIIDISQEYKQVLFNPKHGYGAGMNPCLDCRAYMLFKARKLMESEGASFVFTGEVLGQRPMSQYKQALKIVEKDAGLEGLVLRPLSAQLLDPTIPEINGWVDRDKLLSISGRSRKEQIELAEKLNITDYPQPAGGCCCLPDENYTRKLKDLMTHRGVDVLGPEDFVLLKVGRHFRFPGNVKALVGRDESENNFLERFGEGRMLMESTTHVGPTTLIEGDVTDELLPIIAGITARYGDGVTEPQVTVQYKAADREGEIQVVPLKPDEYADYWV